jgi:hypothetical protein
MFTSNRRTLTTQRTRITECWTTLPSMPRFCSSWDGSTISKVILSRYKREPSNISRSLCHRITAMHRAGTSSDAAICHSRSTPRPTKHTSKLSIGMARTRLSGVLSVCCTTRSTSIATRLTLTLAPSASIPTSPRSGTTWALCTNHVTTRSRMLWMLTREPRSSIRAILISKPVSNFFVLARAMAVHHQLPHKTSTRRRTRLPALLDHPGPVRRSSLRPQTGHLLTARRDQARTGLETSPTSIPHRSRRTLMRPGASLSGRRHHRLPASPRLNRISP